MSESPDEPVLSITPPILLFTHDPAAQQALHERLVAEGYSVVVKNSVLEAVACLREQAISAIVTDRHQPEASGVELFAKASEIQPHTSRLVVSCEDIARRGKGSLAKTCVCAELLPALRNALQRYDLLARNKRLEAVNFQLSRTNSELCAELKQLRPKLVELDEAHAAMEQNFQRSLEICYGIINAFDPLLGEHTRIAAQICAKMAESKYFDDQQKRVLTASAWLHDIGLIEFDRDVLFKWQNAPGRLSSEEQEALRQHPVRGQQLASFVDQLQGVGETIRAHHERFDGLGYPDNLAGETIPWTARCLAVAVYFAESTLPKEKALESVLKESGSMFDPDAVRLFFKMTQSGELPRQIREVMLDELTPGMSLVKGIHSPAGLLLIPEGQPLTPATIAKIEKYNLQASVTQRLLVYS